MVDVVDVATRSRMMAGIRSRDTKPEIALRRAIHALGLRYRLHSKHLPGKPDLIFPRFQAAVFVHGCFWHRHQRCRFATSPATRPDFWSAKLIGNAQRDQRNLKALFAAGWRTAVVWECAIKANGGTLIALQVRDWLHGPEQTLAIPAT